MLGSVGELDADDFLTVLGSVSGCSSGGLGHVHVQAHHVHGRATGGQQEHVGAGVGGCERVGEQDGVE